MSLHNALFLLGMLYMYLTATSSSPPLQCNFAFYTLYCPAWGTLNLYYSVPHCKSRRCKTDSLHNVGNTRKMNLLIRRPRCQIRLAGNPRYLYLFLRVRQAGMAHVISRLFKRICCCISEVGAEFPTFRVWTCNIRQLIIPFLLFIASDRSSKERVQHTYVT